MVQRWYVVSHDTIFTSLVLVGSTKCIIGVVWSLNVGACSDDGPSARYAPTGYTLDALTRRLARRPNKRLDSVRSYYTLLDVGLCADF